jgi:hypothetical protein
MMIYAGCAGVPVAQCTTAPGGKLTRASFAATSHVAYKPLDASGIRALMAKVKDAKGIAGMTEGGISMDALGGAVASLSPDATAFPHRSALMTVQYTATYVNGTAPSAFDDYVRGFRTALSPQWGDGAYVNYADASLSHSDASYFGDNASRLARVRAKYDKNGLFTQPQPW